MKIDKIKNRYLFDGEGDLCLSHNQKRCVYIGQYFGDYKNGIDVKNWHICKIGLTLLDKIKVLWYCAKYIFKKQQVTG